MSNTGHILIIDDDPALRHTLARILQHAGYEATTAASGQEGLQLLAAARQSYDLVYLDIRMPDMNGMDVLKILHARHSEIPVVLFTGQPDLNSAVEALRQGASDYLLKPLQPLDLIARTADILSRQKLESRKRQIRQQIQALEAELKALETRAPAAGIIPSADVLNGTPAPDRSASSEARFIACGKINLDLLARRVRLGEQTVNLPPATFEYLLVLSRHSPNLVDYQTLVTEAQGYQVNFREAQELVKWHIHHIRQAIEPDEHSPHYLINVRGKGYRLVSD